MSLHYPPLANGTYRVGDPPQAFPSPVPGPDSSSPPIPPAPFSPYPPPAPSRPTPRPRAGFFVLGFAFVLLVALTLGALASVTPSSENKATTPLASWPINELPHRSIGAIVVSGVLDVVSPRGEIVTGTPTGCELPPSLSDLGSHTTVQLFDPGYTLLGTTHLTYETGSTGQCIFIFTFENIPSGHASYYLEIPGRGQLNYSESELRKGLYVSLGG